MWWANYTSTKQKNSSCKIPGRLGKGDPSIAELLDQGERSPPNQNRMDLGLQAPPY